MRTAALAIAVASLAVAAGAAEDPVHLRLLSERLEPAPERRAAVAALLRRAHEREAPLAAESARLRGEHKAAMGALYARLDALLGPEQRQGLDPRSPVYHLDRAFLPPLSESARERGRALVEAARPGLDALAAAIAAVEARREAVWTDFDADLPAAAGRPSAARLTAAREALAAARAARRIHDHLIGVADDPVVLGEALERVRASERARDAVIEPWRRAFLARDAGAFAALLAPGFRGPDWTELGAPRRDSVAETAAWRASTRPRARSLESLSAFLDGHAEVLGFDADLFGVEKAAGDVEIHKGLVSVRGRLREGGRRVESTAAMRLAVRDGRIESLELHGGRRVVAAREGLFEDATASAGLAAIPVRPRSESIRRGGYALALKDDGSGPAELYVGSVGGASLLRRGEDGRFADATARAGLGEDLLVKAGVFADLDGDGRDDLLINHFQADPKKALALYRGLGDGRYRAEKRFDFTSIAESLYRYPMTMSAGDFDGDGRTDLYVGFPGTMDFTTMGFEKDGEATEGAARPQGLFLNKGGFDFADRTKYALYADKEYAWSMAYPHSSVAADLDGDHRTDVIVVDDRKNPSTIYRNRGGGAFEEVARELGVWNAHWGMGAAVGDYKNGGSPDLYLTNVNFPASFVMEDDADWLFGAGAKRRNAPGNHLYRNRGDGTFEEVTDEARVRWAGTGAAGAQFFDFDNDGRLDLFVANGLWSAGPQAKPFDSPLLLAEMVEHKLTTMGGFFGVKDLAPVTCRACARWSLMGETPTRKNAVLRMLRDLRDEQGRPMLSLGGDQRNRLFRNEGDGTFTDLAFVAGVDSTADGYVAATAELDRDGALHLFLRNGDPGVETVSYPTVQLFKNRATKGRRHIVLRLTGRESGRDAFGAKVTVERAGGPRQYRELIANNGAAQDARLVHFGLGEDHAAAVSVRWPSGRRQDFPALAAGTYALEEGGEPVLETPGRLAAE
ncbi:MAG: CRTAC1 family protein [Elusimicrobiota bacterium]|nr:CRTAC1 family protein [Elusimicrobiota bacterium]